MCEKWIGSLVSIDCGDSLGWYQGQVTDVNSRDQTLTLQKVCQNGIPSQLPAVTIRSEDIQELTLIDVPKQKKMEPKSSTVPVFRPSTRRLIRSTSECVPTVSRPTDAYYGRSDSPQKNYDDGRNRNGGDNLRTPKKKDRQMRYRDEACFGHQAETNVHSEFDFEKNLALFDKQAVFEEINASQKPDIVRLIDSNVRQQRKYRHDENVINSLPVTYKQICLPETGDKEYTTDSGLIVPSMTTDLRRRLLEVAEHHGLSWDKQLELIGRSAAEMVIQLLGGHHRLNPSNSHQVPRVVFLCGPHRQGEQAISAARHVSSLGVSTVVYVPDITHMTPGVKSEMTLYNMTGQKMCMRTADLPASVDLIVNAMDDHELAYQLRNQPWYKLACSWSGERRAPILALDPPPGGSAIESKFALVPVLPLSYSPQNGKIYLCNLTIPKNVFQEIGIQYSSPFGAKFVIPLHLNIC